MNDVESKNNVPLHEREFGSELELRIAMSVEKNDVIDKLQAENAQLKAELKDLNLAYSFINQIANIGSNTLARLQMQQRDDAQEIANRAMKDINNVHKEWTELDEDLLSPEMSEFDMMNARLTDDQLENFFKSGEDRLNAAYIAMKSALINLKKLEKAKAYKAKVSAQNGSETIK